MSVSCGPESSLLASTTNNSREEKSYTNANVCCQGVGYVELHFTKHIGKASGDKSACGAGLLEKTLQKRVLSRIFKEGAGLIWQKKDSGQRPRGRDESWKMRPKVTSQPSASGVSGERSLRT